MMSLLYKSLAVCREMGCIQGGHEWENFSNMDYADLVIHSISVKKKYSKICEFA